MKSLIFIISVLFFSQSSYAETYDVVLAGKTCEKDNLEQLNCSYKAGKDFHVEIAGVGQEDTGIIFLKSDQKGDYYGIYGLLHGCVIVNGKSFSDPAFISPKNGKVYRSWASCKYQN